MRNIGILLFLCTTITLTAQKTDKLYLPNGDILTGEIKKLEYGIMRFKTSDLGTLDVKWTEVGKIQSDKRCEIILNSNKKYFGHIDTTPEFKIIRILSDEDTFNIKLLDINEITPIKRKFLARIDGNVDIGFNFTKGSEVQKFTFHGEINYRGVKMASHIDINSDITDQPERDQVRKQDANYNFKYFLNNTLFGSGFLGITQNTELGLESRAFAGLGIGKDLVHNHFHQFIGQIGMLVNKENATEGGTSTSNVETFAVLQYRIYRKKVPKVDLNTSIIAIPSLTVKNRIRLEYDIKAKFELISDFYFSLSFYFSYDNKPSDPNASTSDYGINTSIGYSF